MLVAIQYRKKSQKPLILCVQGRLRSFMIIALKSSLPVLVIMSSISVHIYNRFQVRRANSGKRRTF